MQESVRLHTRCPSCGAAKDFDTPTARHYTCATVGSFTTGHYTMNCFPRTTCASCDAMAKLVKTQGEEIKRLTALNREAGKVLDVARYAASMAGQVWEHSQLILCDALVTYEDATKEL